MQQQQISVITLGVADLARSQRFYGEAGFGWRPVFDAVEIAFYQMNGLILGTRLKPELGSDMRQTASPRRQQSPSPTTCPVRRG